MPDYTDIAMRLITGSEILRVKPGALIQLYAAGTSTPLVAEAIADSNGEWEIASLDTGHYDVKVDGQIRASFHFVRADHKHAADKSWSFFKSGIIVGDQDENNTIPVCGPNVDGTIYAISVTAESVTAPGDVTIHVLKGPENTAGVLTVASDSIWNHRINPGSAMNRYKYTDSSPGLSVDADEVITMGIDWGANSVGGVTLSMIFRPNETYPT